MTIFEQLKLIIQAQTIVPIDGFAFEDEYEEMNVFNIGASMGESSWALIIGELSLFQKLSILLSICANPLAWWQIHEGQFPNVGIFVKQILGIPKSQIEIERVFSLANVLTTLRCYLTNGKFGSNHHSGRKLD